jgi:hypothetical protein
LLDDVQRVLDDVQRLLDVVQHELDDVQHAQFSLFPTFSFILFSVLY